MWLYLYLSNNSDLMLITYSLELDIQIKSNWSLSNNYIKYIYYKCFKGRGVLKGRGILKGRGMLKRKGMDSQWWAVVRLIIVHLLWCRVHITRSGWWCWALIHHRPASFLCAVIACHHCVTWWCCCSMLLLLSLLCCCSMSSSSLLSWHHPVSLLHHHFDMSVSLSCLVVGSLSLVIVMWSLHVVVGSSLHVVVGPSLCVLVTLS